MERAREIITQGLNAITARKDRSGCTLGGWGVGNFPERRDMATGRVSSNYFHKQGGETWGVARKKQTERKGLEHERLWKPLCKANVHFLLPECYQMTNRYYT